MNLSWWLERASWEHPGKAAVIDSDGTETDYTSLCGLTNRIGNVLRDSGVGEDDMVLTIMRDHHRHVATFWATVRLGGTFSGLNPKQTAAKYESDVERSGARTLIVDPEFVEIAEQLEGCSRLERIFVSRGTHPRFGSLEGLSAQASDELRILPRSGSDAAAVNFTSGTSGVAKGVIFTHATLTNSCWGSIFLAGVTSDVRNLSLVGMFHSGGIHDTVRLAMAGGTLIWSDGWDVDRVMRIFADHRPNWMYWIIPTMARDLMRHPGWEQLDLQGVKAHIAGEAVPPDVEAALLGKGVQLGNMYGLTEAMPVCVLGPSLYYSDEKRIPRGSSGKPNKEFCEVKLADPLTGDELVGVGEGEVCIRGDVVTPGYFNDPARTAQTIDADGYLHTRDVVYRDEDGWCYVRGRTDDIINSGGEKLSLLEVDAALLEHPQVVDAACIGVAHERFGEVPAAFVVLEGELDDRGARDLLDAHCIATLERWKRPRLYVFVDAVPRTSAKRSKWQGEMRRQLEGVLVRDADGVTTFAAIGERTPTGNPS
jgi:acyl-CoA synthetase (AMP-forming)/AMP-acid ligase II